MGLTLTSTGRGAANSAVAAKLRAGDLSVALAGNPNVGKSTVFNALTGLHQHTGNWPGKTVATAQGLCTRDGRTYLLTDLPGCYSLLAHSAEEEVARDFLCFSDADAAIVVCDAACLERNLNLVLQTLEITGRTVVCVNLMDEARRRGVTVDLSRLSRLLGVPVVPAAARQGQGLEELLRTVDRQAREPRGGSAPVTYPAAVEEALALLEPVVAEACGPLVPARWAALRLLDTDASLLSSLDRALGFSLAASPPVAAALEQARDHLARQGIASPPDAVAAALVRRAEEIAAQCVTVEETAAVRRERRLDRILTSRWAGIPLILLLLAGVFWLTISGANVPSQLLSAAFARLGELLNQGLVHLGAPEAVQSLLMDGVFLVLSWVVSVMLPPMAIFFPLFTLLEDLGYLPRVAFNLDHAFQRCRACGKQALTMAMGFGCNAAGVVGCRIIDSPRERLMALLTNSFVPCNGRFPTLVTLLVLLLPAAELSGALLPALGLTALVLLGVGMTMAVSWLLSRTVLRGVPSSFTLELPPYRLPQVGKVLVRSVLDRTLFVLGRAAAVAAPAGAVLWLLAHWAPGGIPVLARLSGWLDPLGHFLGLDGSILLAFALGFPANEIVLPILLMLYTSSGTLAEVGSAAALWPVLEAQGWTPVTVVCFLLFCLFHWPCSTTLLTIRREAGSLRWTLLALALPTAAGMVLCALTANLARLF